MKSPNNLPTYIHAPNEVIALPRAYILYREQIIRIRLFTRSTYHLIYI